MRSSLALPCVLVAACGFPSPKVADTPDGDVPGPDACQSFSAQLDTCVLSNPIPLMLSGELTFNTDTGVLEDGNGAPISVVSVPVMTRGAEVRALVATSVVLAPNTSLRAEGERGFAIVAHGVITLMQNAVIDVSQGGAGHGGSCAATGPTKGADDTDGAAGGGGGGLGAAGGRGGNGDGDNGQSVGGLPGMPVAPAPEGPLGGCSGAPGGKDMGTNNDGGLGGLGGGAVYLVSAISLGIAPDAGVHAGGGGGGGGEREGGAGDAGGGGGGSGGSIFLEAPVIRCEGILAANGGGGGEGSGGNLAGLPGAPGPFQAQQAAGGQGGATTGADGGSGGFHTTPDGAMATQILNGGGGGGGGGVGFIHVRSADAQLGVASPTPMR